MKVSTIQMNIKLTNTDRLERLMSKAKRLNDELRETIEEINNCKLEVDMVEVGELGEAKNDHVKTGN